MKMKKLKLLFIGNSHTYYNDMPLMVQRRATDEGFDCHITMIAHGGWYLAQHAEEPDVRFNILYGGYDYVILQEYGQPFAPEQKFAGAVRTLNEWIREAGSTPILYETWAAKEKPEDQEHINEVYRKIAKQIDAPVAAAGENWWGYQESWPNLEMYDPDGEHASAHGSNFAAKYIWETILDDLHLKEIRRKL